MSLDPQSYPAIPEQTKLVAEAAFPQGNPYLTLHRELGVIFCDEDFADLFPTRGQHAYAPWRLALVTILQFRENLSDRQAAEAVRSRIDWKYVLALELGDSGFDYSVLSKFRTRLLEGKKEALLLDKLLARLQEVGVIKSRGRQRSDSTHVLASVRELNRLEHLAETMRAALNELAEEVPDWLRSIAPEEWYVRYGRRIEDSRLPQKKTDREAYLMQVGDDGFRLLDALESGPQIAKVLEKVAYLREIWSMHYVRKKPPNRSKKQVYGVRLKVGDERPPISTKPQSPYDPQARYGNKRTKKWVGYKVHLSESCDEDAPRILTHTMTTEAGFHDQHCASLIHEALARKQLLPGKHLVDTAYVNADVLVESQKHYQVKILGATMANSSWQTREKGAFKVEDFELDWKARKARCPGEKESKTWGEFETEKMGKFVRIQFRIEDCLACPLKSNCTKATWLHGRQLTIKRREQYEALQALRAEMKTEEGKENRNLRAGIEGTISQAVRGFGLRKARYRSLAKTRLQHLATAAAINVDRLFFYKQDREPAKTRVSHFAALMPQN